MTHRQTCLRSKRVITPQGVRPAIVVFEGEKIVEVSDFNAIPRGSALEDVGDLVISPGLVDSHVHINEPGRTEWEGFESATKAAAAGGITTLVDMPLNSSPVTTTVNAFKKKLASAEGKLYVDCGFYGGLIPGNTDDLKPLIDAGVLGVKAFLVHSGIDEFPNATEEELCAGMPIIAKSGLPLLVHCELQSHSNNPIIPQSKSRNYADYISSRPRQWEHDAIDLMIRLCREFSCRTHVVHLSSADAVSMLVKARKSGHPLTIETCPHYLVFSAEEIHDGDTRFKCAPPIRENENRVRLWQALKDGTIDFIVSDHSPSPPEFKLLKEGDFQKAWGGIASLQFGLPAVWTEAKKFGFRVEDVSRWMSSQPTKFLSLDDKKGSISPGHDADFVVWNPEESFTVEPSVTFHRHKVTPYEGKILFGKVEKTYLRGELAFEKGSIVGRQRGSVLYGKHKQRSTA
ncbi:MAG: allantoinase AllB [Ignavibacteriales bacterium]|nr:allantoinase AllB [Ignavibacteriales bacterium]